MAGMPRLGEFHALVRFFGLEQMQTVVEIVRFCSWNECFEEFRPVLGQGECFNLVDFACG